MRLLREHRDGRALGIGRLAGGAGGPLTSECGRGVASAGAAGCAGAKVEDDGGGEKGSRGILCCDDGRYALERVEGPGPGAEVLS